MSKLEQVLQLEPYHELRFKGPFTDVVTSELVLKNPLDKKVCFKVKTTAPRRYCVRPNGGIIDPNSTVTVAVMLQPFEYDPNEKNKHKFMVQTMIVPEGHIENLENLWKNASGEKIMDSKLKCVFDMPAQEQLQNNLNLSKEENLTTTTPQLLTQDAPVPTRTMETSRDKPVDDQRKMKDTLALFQNENQKLKDENERLKKLVQKDSFSKKAPSDGGQLSEQQTALPTGIHVVAGIILIFVGITIAKLFL
ncbi:DgyrCDS5933 [Dimorphilus gyrociliatus]|uniref:DgyrCDS5933 n=1 Tax=Dimorphilus gyrociliatus TaxID=2664684 RepID=A0A7I8VP99_9ANNE|nr:DgyrCDS5933 [Dimorphilus gyrociliatus]